MAFSGYLFPEQDQNKNITTTDSNIKSSTNQIVLCYPLVPLSTNQVLGPIRRESIPTRRKFTLFDTSKLFCILFKSPTTINDNDSSGVQIIDKD
ncbi:26691_t:CDS:2 [Dentiscutata erythropus]|uniref:26691_t:CDS:1 n=1 Tax=Dentiscutata erythropus TaxID=1348616 RepID=A0A9N9EHS4_9GLOM|nr:26691_t:CDS:2 [Dentiscutata erythropus]